MTLDAAGKTGAIGSLSTALLAPPAMAVRAAHLTLRYGAVTALDDVALQIPCGQLLGLIGPDGVGKSSLLALVAGCRRLQAGSLQVLDADMTQRRARERACPRIAYMPQGLGKNLYDTLSVTENLDFFGRLFGLSTDTRRAQIEQLLAATGLTAFSHRPAGKLSGGMRQKLGLCCALIHDPELLILDEPTTGVDPLARAQFWALIGRLRAARIHMTVLVATAYMDEARQFDWLIAMDAGKVLTQGAPHTLLEQTGCADLEAAFVAVLPQARRQGYRALVIEPRAVVAGPPTIAIEAQQLTCRFGEFTAVDRVSFKIAKGEVFGFLGSNGCGKSTTMKMLTGLLPSTSGQAWLFGQKVNPNDLDARRRVGYMTQSFSLYNELTVVQNLRLHAQLFEIPVAQRDSRLKEALVQFGLEGVADSLPATLALGMRQRLSLAVAVIHRPEVLILDEPTSGVDPIARDTFWRLLLDLSRQHGVTIFISTHFMNEAARCDRIALMHAGRVLAVDTPQALVAQSGLATLEQAFIDVLRRASEEPADPPAQTALQADFSQPSTMRAPVRAGRSAGSSPGMSLRRLLSYCWRETLEIRRDPIRLTMAGLGTVLLMIIMSYGISLDVEDLPFAVLDRDHSVASEGYLRGYAGSRYVLEQAPVTDYAQMRDRLANGSLGFALEIPAGFGRDLQRGRPTSVAAWVDGAMPMRASTIEGYVSAIHAQYLAGLDSGAATPPATLEVRYRYNPDVKSLAAMVPAIIALLLMMIPAMLTALGVVREKELGSIINLYVTPVTRLEFLLGKQLPYLAMGMVNFFTLVAMAVGLFGVPVKGSFIALTLGALLYLGASTSLGLWLSSFLKSQIAAIFGVTLATLVPAIQFCGLINPVSSLEGFGAWVGHVYPTAFFLTITRGAFSKGLMMQDLWPFYLPLLLATPLFIGLSVAMLDKQER